MVVLIVLFALLFVLLLFAMPVIVTVYGRFSPKGGVLHMKLLLFGALPVPLRMRIRLFSSPYLSLQFRGRNFPLLSSRPRTTLHPRAARLERLDLGVTLGIEEDPAATVRTIGLLGAVASLLLPRIAPRGSVQTHPSFSGGVFRLSLQAVGLVVPLFLLFRRQPRIKKTDLSNANTSISEKRYSHVPC